MTEEKSKNEGSCCKPAGGSGGCCNCKKFFVGVVAGVLLAVVAHCFLCPQGGNCGKSSKMCPLTPPQTMAVPAK